MCSLKAFVIKIDPVNPAKEIIASAAKIIRGGGLVVFPTETVYGIAANFLDEKAVNRLYEVKSRPKTKPFTVHISDLKTIKDMACAIDAASEKLIAKFWPGPLTIILNSCDGRKIGFRMPANRVAFELIRASGVPIVAPSANLSGHSAPVTAQDAMIDLEDKVDMIIDSGRTEVGFESTVVDMTVSPFNVIRTGAVKEEDLSKAING